MAFTLSARRFVQEALGVILQPGTMTGQTKTEPGIGESIQTGNDLAATTIARNCFPAAHANKRLKIEEVASARPDHFDEWVIVDPVDGSGNDYAMIKGLTAAAAGLIENNRATSGAIGSPGVFCATLTTNNKTVGTSHMGTIIWSDHNKVYFGPHNSKQQFVLPPARPMDPDTGRQTMLADVNNATLCGVAPALNLPVCMQAIASNVLSQMEVIMGHAAAAMLGPNMDANGTICNGPKAWDLAAPMALAHLNGLSYYDIDSGKKVSDFTPELFTPDGWVLRHRLVLTHPTHAKDYIHFYRQLLAA